MRLDGTVSSYYFMIMGRKVKATGKGISERKYAVKNHKYFYTGFPLSARLVLEV